MVRPTSSPIIIDPGLKRGGGRVADGRFPGIYPADKAEPTDTRTQLELSEFADVWNSSRATKIVFYPPLESFWHDDPGGATNDL